MKITGSPIGGLQRLNGAGPGASRTGGFTTAKSGGGQGAAATARAGGASGVTSLDALLALQEVDTPTERRRRSVRRASRILDELDGVKVALLGGDEAGAMIQLTKAVRDERAATEDPELEDLLNAIDVRAAVELAKRETRRPLATPG